MTKEGEPTLASENPLLLNSLFAGSVLAKFAFALTVFGKPLAAKENRKCIKQEMNSVVNLVILEVAF